MRRGSRTGGALVGWGLLAVLAGCSGGGTEAPAEDAAPPQEASGFLRPVAPRSGEVLAAEKEPATEPEAPGAGAEQDVSAAEVPQVTAPQVATPAPQPRSETQPRSEAAGSDYDDAADVELAAALLHRTPAAFQELLDRRKDRLAAPRLELLTAFVAARAGALDQAREAWQGLKGSDALTAAESDLLGRACEPDKARAVPAALALATPLERAMEMALLEREALERAGRGDAPAAARAWSQLLLAELASPWEADREAMARWSEALHAAQQRHRWSPGGEWPSIEVTVQPGDSLIAIRKRVLEAHPELLLCTGLIAKANGLEHEQDIQPDDVLRIPTDRASALVDVSARWTLYLHGQEVVAAWEVGVGKEQGSTRPGTYTISLKQANPMWFRPGRDPVPFGDPENPLGTRWLEWGVDGKGTSLGFHGTNDPDGVGGRVSEGCVRMRNEEVELLYDILPREAEVVVQP